MSALTHQPSYTMAEFMALPDHGLYELVDGELMEICMSNLASWVAVKVSTRLDVYCSEKRIGAVFSSETYFKCFPSRPRNARKPDVSFISQERLPADWSADGFFTIAPDLAVEVLSPNDLVYEVDQKIREYLDAGVKLVWVINPEQRLIQIHRADGTVTKLKETDFLGGEDIIPGFSCPVVELFPPR